MESNYLFQKKVQIKRQSKNKDVLVMFILLLETKNSDLFDKNCTRENVKCHIHITKKVDLDES